MSRKFSLLALIVALVMGSSASPTLFGSAEARAHRVTSAAQSSAASTDTVTAIVELQSEPVAVRQRAKMPSRPRSRAIDFESADALADEGQVAAEQSDFISRAALVSPSLRVRHHLRKLANAVSVEVPASDVAALASLPGVMNVELSREYHTLLDASVPLINAPALWDRLGGQGAAGEGIKIAIIDTGIDITNPMFSGAGFSMPAGFPRTNNGSDGLVNNKVIVAKSYLTGGKNATDENGHGSNVAGIAAGDAGTTTPLGVISGVAPRAYLGNYRVLDDAGRGSTDSIARAIEDAVADGFDVISMSLGASASSTLGLLEREVETAVNTGGKIVVIAAGNDGQGGVDDDMTIASPGIAPSAITVAASSNAHVVGPVIKVEGPQPVSPSLVSVLAVLGSGSTGNFDDTFKNQPLVEVTQNRACSPLTANAIQGVALIERGNCTFVSKINTAAQAGARAAIIYNNDLSENPDSGGDNLVTMQVDGTAIPSIFVGRTNGLALRDFVRSNPSTTVSIAPIGSAGSVGDVLADFSSRGPSTIGQLKPDITAPGVIIYSAAITTPNANGVSDPSGFLAISGTSQATPHVAGSAALVKQLNPSFSPQQVKSVLMNSATGAVFTTSAKNAFEGVLAAGAGRVDLASASSVTATALPASISFGINKLKKKDVTLTSDVAITSQIDGQNTFSITIQQLDPGDGVTVTASTGSLTLTRGQTGMVTVTIFAAKRAEKRDYTGYLVVTQPSGQSLHIPFWARYRKKV
jgi:minor extracellular serine protease Vpr